MSKSVLIGPALEDEALDVLKLQYLCYQREAEIYGDYRIEPLTQSLDQLREELTDSRLLVARLGEEIVGSVRGRVDERGSGRIGKIMVHPRLQGHGLGGRLVRAIEDELASGRPGARRYSLFTGNRSEGNLRLYRRLGYTEVASERVSPRLTLITLEKELLAA